MATYIEIDDTEVAPEAPVTTSLVTRLRDNALAYLGAPTGTRLPLQQTAAPTGWNKEASSTYNDRAIRLVTGTVSSGGNVSFSNCFARTATDDHAITMAQMRQHLHASNFDTSLQDTLHSHAVIRYNALVTVQSGAGATNIWQGTTTVSTGTEDANHAHEVAGDTDEKGSNDGHHHDIDLRLQYIDFCIFQKAA